MRRALAMRLADDRFTSLVAQLFAYLSDEQRRDFDVGIHFDADIFDEQADALIIAAMEVLYSCAPLTLRWPAAKCLRALGAIREDRAIQELVHAGEIGQVIAAYQQA